MSVDDKAPSRTTASEDRPQDMDIARRVAEEANRLKTEFLAITSHELRTPLNGILGSLGVIQNGLCDSREEELEFVRKAYISSQHLLSVIDNLLDLEKIESGRLHASLEPISLRRLFDATQKRTSGLAKQKALALSFDIPENNDLIVRGDEARLQQILLNLVGNAIKFTVKGHVRIRAFSRPEKGHAAVSVEDSGVGIAPAQQRKLFDSFVQADGSTTRKFGGTGLGLSISRQLIERMGGTLTLFSEGEGKGTTLTLTIPLNSDSPAPTDQEGSSSPAIDAQPLALVVEDDPGIRQFVEGVLSSQGYRTVGVETADEALAALAVETPALITLDIGLPSNPNAQLRTGWNLLRVIDEWVGSHLQGPRPTVLIVSGHDAEVAMRVAEERYLCAPRVLPKPFTVQQLLAALPAVPGLTGLVVPHTERS
jgi:nitrogen-specific signal transduction histidine kinase/CheY-like chemotaxis protein